MWPKTMNFLAFCDFLTKSPTLSRKPTKQVWTQKWFKDYFTRTYQTSWDFYYILHSSPLISFYKLMPRLRIQEHFDFLSKLWFFSEFSLGFPLLFSLYTTRPSLEFQWEFSLLLPTPHGHLEEEVENCFLNIRTGVEKSNWLDDDLL